MTIFARREVHMRPSSATPAFLFDLDGTLIDSVYQHVLAWSEALSAAGIDISTWRIHRRIGMSGGLFARALAREAPIDMSIELRERLRRLHAERFKEKAASVRPLPGARELLRHLDESAVPWAIATSGRIETAGPTIATLGVDIQANAHRIVTRDHVEFAKPNPDLFLEAADRIGVEPAACFVVGDSIWDMLGAVRAGSMPVGLLSGGYGKDELLEAGAFRVFDDPADLLARIFELGLRT